MVIPELFFSLIEELNNHMWDWNLWSKIWEKDVTIGLSDGVKVEVLSGIEMSDKIKIWNKTEPIKIEPEESAFDEFEDR